MKIKNSYTSHPRILLQWIKTVQYINIPALILCAYFSVKAEIPLLFFTFATCIQHATAQFYKSQVQILIYCYLLSNQSINQSIDISINHK